MKLAELFDLSGMEKNAERLKKNAKRQEEGYDGVSTKCPGCHRALDDDAVLCTVTYWDGVGEEARQTNAAHSVKAEYYCFTERRTIA